MWVRTELVGMTGLTEPKFRVGDFRVVYAITPVKTEHPLLMLGGANVLCKVGYTTTGASTGQTSITTGFRPDLIFTSTNWWPHGDPPADPEFDDGSAPASAGYVLSWGACDADLNQWAAAIKGYDYPDQGVGAASSFYDGAVLVDDGGTIEVVSLDDDGFTVAHDLNSRYFGWLAVQLTGNRARVGVLTQPGSTGIQDTTGLDCDPAALIISGTEMTTDDDPGYSWNGSRAHYGVYAANGGVVWTGGGHSPDPSWAWNGQTLWTALCYIYNHPTAGHPGATTLCYATPSLIADGFRLNWGVNDGIARKWGYVVLEADEAYDSTLPRATYHVRASHDLRNNDTFTVKADGNLQAQVGFASAPDEAFSAGVFYSAYSGIAAKTFRETFLVAGMYAGVNWPDHMFQLRSPRQRIFRYFLT